MYFNLPNVPCTMLTAYKKYECCNHNWTGSWLPEVSKDSSGMEICTSVGIRPFDVVFAVVALSGFLNERRAAYFGHCSLLEISYTRLPT